jgi:hypothetical protein
MDGSNVAFGSGGAEGAGGKWKSLIDPADDTLLGKITLARL